MPKVTCDYMVPMTVRVDTDTGDVEEVWLHLESFQSSSPGWFRSENDSNQRLTLRQAFIGGVIDHPEGEFADGESELADKALAIGDRVTLHTPEFEIRNYTLEPVGVPS